MGQQMLQCVCVCVGGGGQEFIKCRKVIRVREVRPYFLDLKNT